MKKLGFLFCLFLCLIAAAGFYWLWKQANLPVSSSSTASNYTPVEVEAVKTQATDLLSALEKNSDIPLKTPTDKMGRSNPYSGL